MAVNEAVVVSIRRVKPWLWESSVTHGRTVYLDYAFTRWGIHRIVHRKKAELGV